MPLYIADYLADTAHLNAAQSGAYLHLIMHYWQKRGLPTDDRQLAAIARMTPRKWSRERDIIAAFFHDGWKHKRIDAELARSEDISSKRRASAVQRHSKRDANAEQLDTQSQPQPPQEDRIADAPARGASMLTEGSKARASAFWKALGIGDARDVPPEFAGVDLRAVEWEAAGWPVEMIAAEARRIGPAKPLAYHEKVFATAHAKLHAPLPKVEIRSAETVQVTHAKFPARSGVVAAARRLADHFVGEPVDRVAPDSGAVLRLSQG
jgi:uncharacterized protein YdaU (DUF1376 family)